MNSVRRREAAAIDPTLIGDTLMIRSFAVCSLFALVSAVPVVAAEATSQPIRLAWDANPGETIAGYSVWVGTRSGVYSESYDVRSGTAFIYDKGTAGQRYYFAVSAYASTSSTSPLSSEVSAVASAVTTVPVAPPPPTIVPPPVTTPDDVLPGIVLAPAVIANGTATFRWTAVGDWNPTEYLVEVGSKSGDSDMANMTVATATSAVIKIARGNNYYVRVRGRASQTTSLMSNEVVYSFLSPRCATPPPTPTMLKGLVSGGNVTLTWKGSSAATSYVVQVGSVAGQSNLFQRNVGNVLTVASPLGAVPAYARVIAVNGCGTSAASAEIVLK
jgi:hypothetical protein